MRRKLTLSYNFFFICIWPFVLVSTTYWGLVWDHYVIISCSCFFPIFFELNQVSCVSLAVKILTINRIINFWLELGFNTLGGRVQRKSGRLWQVWRGTCFLCSASSRTSLIPILVSSITGWFWWAGVSSMIAARRETTWPCRRISPIIIGSVVVSTSS